MGLGTDARVALFALRGDRSLLPDFQLNRARDLDPQELLSLGIRHVLFDFDSTLADWGRRSLPESSQRLIEVLLEAGLTVAIVSNGHSGRFRRLNQYWRDRHVFFLGRCGKPGHKRLAAFLEEQGWDPSKTLVVGDNVMADVAAARGAGCRAALVRPWSWFEFPLTKVWRVLEDVHQLIRRREWQEIRHIGTGPPRGRWIASPEVFLVILLLGSLLVMYLPLIRGPLPASEISSLQLGIATDRAAGWPLVSRLEPERSLLVVSLLSVLPDKTLPGSFARFLAGSALLSSALLTYALFRRTLGVGIGTVLVGVMWLSPAFLASAGELSPSTLELFFVLALILSRGRLVISGILFLLALLNGLSAFAIAPLVLVSEERSKARLAFGVLAVGSLLACALWVMAITEAQVPGPGWDARAAEQGSIGFATFKVPPTPRVRDVLFSLERDAERALFGKPGIGWRLPLITAAFLSSLPSLAQVIPGFGWFLALRAGAAAVLPGLFMRPMLLTVLMPFVILAFGLVLKRVGRGYACGAFAILLAFLVLSNSSNARRQILVARRNYRANPELISLARTAGATLDRTVCIATPAPAFFHLFSGLQTVAQESPPLKPPATHIVQARAPSPDEDCILQRTLMLCPE